MNLAVDQTSSSYPDNHFYDYGVSDASQVVRSWWQELLAGRQRARTFGTIRAARFIVCDIGARCREPNWDGEGADAVTGDVLDEAMKIAIMLPPSFPFPEVEADPDGSITFVWRPKRNHMFLLSVHGRRHLAYAGFSGTRSEVHGTETIGTSLPSVVVSYLRKLYF